MDASRYTYSIEEVLPPLYPNIETMDFYCYEVDKSNIANVLKEFGEILPISEENKHLKRVDKCTDDSNRLRVLAIEKRNDDCLDLLKQITSISIDNLLIVKVPRYPAETKEQYTEGRALWPITYHPITPPPALTYDEIERFTTAMSRAIELGNRAGSAGNAPVGMVILDISGNIICESEDNRKELFLDHCCFRGIGKQSEELHKRYIGKRVTKEDPYLCTNCDVVITREPCLMCCMCLLHSRVRRVIYGCDDINGALKSHIQLQNIPKVNHHYRVFRGVLENDCKQLWMKYVTDQKQFFVCF